MDVGNVVKLFSSPVRFSDEIIMKYEVFGNLGQKKFESLCNLTEKEHSEVHNE